MVQGPGMAVVAASAGAANSVGVAGAGAGAAGCTAMVVFSVAFVLMGVCVSTACVSSETTSSLAAVAGAADWSVLSA